MEVGIGSNLIEKLEEYFGKNVTVGAMSFIIIIFIAGVTIWFINELVRLFELINHGVVEVMIDWSGFFATSILLSVHATIIYHRRNYAKQTIDDLKSHAKEVVKEVEQQMDELRKEAKTLKI